MRPDGRRELDDAAPCGERCIALGRGRDRALIRGERAGLIVARALRVAEPAPQIGAARIADAAIAVGVPRGQRLAQPARRIIGIARRERSARTNCDRVDIERIAQHEARREVARTAQLATRGECIDRFFEEDLARSVIGFEVREPRAGLAALRTGATLALHREQLVEHRDVLGCGDRRDRRPAALGADRVAEDVEREIAERVVQPQPIARLGRRFGFALEAIGGGRGVAVLHRELGELVPRTRAQRIELHRRFVVAQRIRGAQRANLGERGVDEAGRDGGGMLRRIGMIGERAEVQRGLAPQLAVKAALAERERDVERFAIEPMRLVEQLMCLVAVRDELAGALHHSASRSSVA